MSELKQTYAGKARWMFHQIRAPHTTILYFKSQTSANIFKPDVPDASHPSPELKQDCLIWKKISTILSSGCQGVVM